MLYIKKRNLARKRAARPQAQQITVHPAILLSLMIGLILNAGVCYAGYDYNQAMTSGTGGCWSVDALSAFRASEIGFMCGLPLCLFGAVYSPWKQGQAWIGFAVVAVVLNVSPFWLNQQIDSYVQSTHSSSVLFDGCSTPASNPAQP